MCVSKLKALTVHELGAAAAGNKVIKVHVLSLLCKAVEKCRSSCSWDVKAKLLQGLKGLFLLDGTRVVTICLTEHNLSRERGEGEASRCKVVLTLYHHSERSGKSLAFTDAQCYTPSTLKCTPKVSGTR